METKNKPVYKLTFSAVMVALASALSLIKLYELPLGGSVTLFEHAADCGYIYFLRS